MKPQDSRRSSFQDEIIQNILKDITEPNIQIPSTDPNNFFAPISPAAIQSANQNHIPSQLSNVDKPTSNLMELLCGGNKSKANQSSVVGNELPMKTLSDVPGKVLSLEEIEANYRRQGEKVTKNSNNTPNMNAGMHHGKTDDDMAAFKRLVSFF